MTAEEYISPRKKEAERKKYTYDRFDNMMEQVYKGEVPRALALAAFADEYQHIQELTQEPSNG